MTLTDDYGGTSTFNIGGDKYVPTPVDGDKLVSTLQDGDRITLGRHTIQVVVPRSPAEDVSLFTPNPSDATMAMDRNARVRISCPQCASVGSVDAARIYGGKKIAIRCPHCQNRFDPASN